MIAGDSHANWVSDLVWLDTQPYDPVTGEGSVGVEFAGSAVSSPSPAGQNITIDRANNVSRLLLRDNREMQWQEIYYRGYFELHVTPEAVNATYFGIPTVNNRNPNELQLASFQVLSGENRIRRSPTPGGGVAENGALRGGRIVQTNLTTNTNDKTTFIHKEENSV